MIDELEITMVSKHEDYNSSLFRMASSLEGMASVDNLLALDAAIKKAEDKKPLEDAQAKLVALLGAKIKAMESLIKLQQAYVDYVEVGDAAAINDLGNFNKKWEKYTNTMNAYQSGSS